MILRFLFFGKMIKPGEVSIIKNKRAVWICDLKVAQQQRQFLGLDWASIHLVMSIYPKYVFFINS